MSTKEQIAEWKAKHGDIFEYTVDQEKNKKCYLRRPDRKVLGLAAISSGGDPMKYNEIVINNCWLGGDDDIRFKDAYFLGLSAFADQLVEIKTGELKKL